MTEVLSEDEITQLLTAISEGAVSEPEAVPSLYKIVSGTFKKYLAVLLGRNVSAKECEIVAKFDAKANPFSLEDNRLITVGSSDTQFLFKVNTELLPELIQSISGFDKDSISSSMLDELTTELSSRFASDIKNMLDTKAETSVTKVTLNDTGKKTWGQGTSVFV